ncbi:MAG: hypothetical protein V7700_12465 [Halioglobus sp.]
MVGLLEKLMPWGPVFFGVLIFAPMWSAAIDAAAVTLPYGLPSLTVTLVVGLLWGITAKIRGRWL